MSNQPYALSQWLDAELKKRKFPFRVKYAPERTDRANASNPVILFMRDAEASEKIEAPKGNQPNPNKRRTRRIPCKIKIYAASTLPGATLPEHEELADYLVDAIVIALDEWNSSESGGGIEFGEMAFLTPDELVDPTTGKPESWPGVVFVIRFSIGRGVVKRDYLKQARPTAAINGTGSTVEVRHNESDTPEVIPVGPQP
jgi:hypothetical protein